MTLSAQDRREVLRQLDRDVDARFGLDKFDKLSDDLYPSCEPSAFWTFMEGKTECMECGTGLNVCRLCPHGCLDELEQELLGVGGPDRNLGTRDRRGWIRR